MNFSDISDRMKRMPELSILEKRSKNPELVLTGFCYTVPLEGEDSWQPFLLYVLTAEKLTGIRFPAECSLLQIGGCLPEECANGIVLADTPGIRQRVKDLCCDLLQTEAAWQAVSGAFFTGKTMQQLTNLISDLVDSPVFLVDLNYHFLTTLPSKFTVSNETLLHHLHQGVPDQESILKINQADIVEKASRADRPFSFHLEEGVCFFVSPVRRNGVLLGYLNLLQMKEEITEGDLTILQRTTDLFADAIYREDSDWRRKVTPGGVILDQLLSGEITDEESARKQFSANGYETCERFIMLVIFLRGQSVTNSSLASYIGGQMRHIFRNIIYTSRENELVFLLDVSEFTDARKKHLKGYLSSNHQTCGISRCGENLTDVPMLYRQAVSALRFGDRFNPDEALHKSEQYRIYQLLSDSRQTLQADFLTDSAAAVLMKYDEKKHTNLLISSGIFLRESCRIPAAAKALSVHENTLRYRIKKAEELTGMDFSDSRACLEFQLELYMIRLNEDRRDLVEEIFLRGSSDSCSAR